MTTPEYWDCECDGDYIRPCKLKRCSKCGARRGDMPDSMVDEVMKAGLPLQEVAQ